MELFLFRHAEWARLYNCTGLDIDAVPMEQRTKFGPEAFVLCLLCALYYLLYVPCIYSIWHHLHANPCYKLLFYIGIMDMANLWILGFLHAWLSFQGAVFCSYPVFLYWVGLGATTFWIAESSVDLVLALNRCLEIVSPKLTDQLFAGCRTYAWMAACSLYSLYWLLFIKPVTFSSIHFAWFFFPFVGYSQDSANQFSTPIHSFHDGTVAIASPIIYLLFAIVFYRKTTSKTSQLKITHAQKMSFLQIFLISAINTLTGILYVIMQLTEPGQLLITAGTFAWFHIHGFPPVMYLALNKTIRNDCRVLLQKIFCQGKNLMENPKNGVGGMDIGMIKQSVKKISPQAKSLP